MAWSIFTDGGGDEVAVGWAKQLLKMIGAPDTPGNEQFIYQWEKSEGGGGKYNPLNQGPVSGHPEWTTTGEQYGGGAADYASWEAGLEGAAAYLGMSNYSAVKAALLKNDPVGARNALWSSPWAASHYGYGSEWSNASLPNGTAVLPASNTGSSDSSGSGANYTYNKDTCAWGMSFPSTGLFGINIGGGGFCVISKTEARALIGGLLVTGGAFMMLFGAATLIAYGLKSTGAIDAATKAVGLVPGVGTAAKMGSKAAKAGAKKSPPKGKKPYQPYGAKVDYPI